MQNRQQSMSEIQLALNKIFGPNHQFHLTDRLPDLELLKKTFRKKSLLYHPDRAQVLGLHEHRLTQKFQEISDAYQRLLPFIRQKRPRFIFNEAAAKPRSAASTGQTYWRLEYIPRFRLRFAQFLYYKGLISFQTLIRAITAQMRCRPRVGRLAVDSNLLPESALFAIMRHKKLGEPFLQAAVRLGYLSERQRVKLLGLQRAFNFPIGKYFTDEGIISRTELATLMSEFKAHNRSFSNDE